MPPPPLLGCAHPSLAHGERLPPLQEFLNDSLVDFEVKYIEQQLEAEHPLNLGRVHIFNSFFYKRLLQTMGGPRLSRRLGDLLPGRQLRDEFGRRAAAAAARAPKGRRRWQHGRRRRG